MLELERWEKEDADDYSELYAASMSRLAQAQELLGVTCWRREVEVGRRVEVDTQHDKVRSSDDGELRRGWKAHKPYICMVYECER